MDNEAKILSAEPVRLDTMMFKKGGAESSRPPTHNKQVEYFSFYKAYDRSSKIDKRRREELLESSNEEDVQEAILRKNLKLLLQDIDDLNTIQQTVQSKNNILDIRRCILQYAEKARMNRQSSQSFTTELVLESLVMKFQQLNSNHQALKQVIQAAAA